MRQQSLTQSPGSNTARGLVTRWSPNDVAALQRLAVGKQYVTAGPILDSARQLDIVGILTAERPHSDSLGRRSEDGCRIVVATF